jgi:hypothetical protein
MCGWVGRVHGFNTSMVAGGDRGGRQPEDSARLNNMAQAVPVYEKVQETLRQARSTCPPLP